MELAREELRLFGLQECFAYRLQGGVGTSVTLRHTVQLRTEGYWRMMSHETMLARAQEVADRVSAPADGRGAAVPRKPVIAAFRGHVPPWRP